MSADEIRSLAFQAFVDGIPSPSHRAGLLYIEDRCKQYATALLDYAAVVERCEKARATIAKRNKAFREVWGNDDAFDGDKLLDYILEGAKDETK